MTVPKMKTHKAAKKRLKRTATRKWTHKRAGRGHLLEKKTARRKRRLRQDAVLHKGDAQRLERLLPYA